MKQKVTDLEVYKSGLTPQQEQVAALMASGKTITDTAADLQISRTTIYRLMQDDLFSAFYSLLCREVKLNTRNNLMALQGKAFEAIKTAIEGDNDTARLKAATWVIERIEAIELSNSDPISAIREQCMTEFEYVGLDVKRFERLRREHGL